MAEKVKPAFSGEEIAEKIMDYYLYEVDEQTEDENDVKLKEKIHSFLDKNLVVSRAWLEKELETFPCENCYNCLCVSQPNACSQIEEIKSWKEGFRGKLLGESEKE